jgi:hypothetical protein
MLVVKPAPLRIILGLAMAAGIARHAFGQAGGETPSEIIAVQVRKQGHSCNKPLSAKRDVAPSKPGEAVWVLKCENATYRVRLIPDMAASIERLD